MSIGEMPTISMKQPGAGRPERAVPPSQEETAGVISSAEAGTKFTLRERLKKQVEARKEQATAPDSVKLLQNYPELLKKELEKAKESLVRYTPPPPSEDHPPVKNLATIKLGGLKILDGVFKEKMEEFQAKNPEAMQKQVVALEKQKAAILERKRALKAPIDEALSRKGMSFAELDANLLGSDRKIKEKNDEESSMISLQTLQSMVSRFMPEVMSMKTATELEQALKSRPDIFSLIQNTGFLQTALEREKAFRKQKDINDVVDELNAGGKEVLSLNVLDNLDQMEDQVRDVGVKISSIVRPYEAKLKGTFPGLVQDLVEGQVEGIGAN